jgi:hypothetical protein
MGLSPVIASDTRPCTSALGLEGLGGADVIEIARVVGRFAPRPRPNQIDRAVDRDAVHPGAEVGP